MYNISNHLDFRFSLKEWTRLIRYHDPTMQYTMGLQVIQTDVDKCSMLHWDNDFHERKVHVILQDKEVQMSVDAKTLLYAILVTVPILF